jgi:hypothetical protein
VISLLLTLCVLNACSDDSVGVLGNERVCWDASENTVTYEVAADGVLCVAVLAPETCDTLLPTCRGDEIRTRACNAYGCSGWSDPVEAWPYLCIDGNREVPCFTGAPCRLPPSRGCTE